MPTHTIRQGDHLSRIADEAGFSEPHAIWDDPANAELKDRRPNPHILMPGDEIEIPERELKYESAATEQRHRFRYRRSPLKLIIRLVGYDREPVADAACVLRVMGEAYELTTDSDGLIEQEITRRAESATLVFHDASVPYPAVTRIQIGHLDPIDERTGQEARLANLGYLRICDLDHDHDFHQSVDERLFKLAVEEFQLEHGLTVDAICGPNTQAKLEAIHGC